MVEAKGVHLKLPGGDVTVWRKQLGLLELLKTYSSFLWKLYMVDLRAHDPYIADVDGKKLLYQCFFEPPIPEELWTPQKLGAAIRKPWYQFNTRG